MKRAREFLLLVLWYLLMGAVVAVYAYVAMLVLFRVFGPVATAARGVLPALAG